MPSIPSTGVVSESGAKDGAKLILTRGYHGQLRERVHVRRQLSLWYGRRHLNVLGYVLQGNIVLPPDDS